MGSPEDELGRYTYEGPQHEVTVPGFFMSKHAITLAQWLAFEEMSSVDHAWDPDEYWDCTCPGNNFPMDSVNWYGAVEFCARLKQHSGRSYRLPTEAEWEYASRAGTTTPYYFGDVITPNVARYDRLNNPDRNWQHVTIPVDYLDVANAFGLHGMHGNGWEWCEDHWHPNYQASPTDCRAWVTDNANAERILRGGSWFHPAGCCRSAHRGHKSPADYDDTIGLRIVGPAPQTL
jgi:formylglycine-generating enzyme required for sulfatase activity